MSFNARAVLLAAALAAALPFMSVGLSPAAPLPANSVDGDQHFVVADVLAYVGNARRFADDEGPAAWARTVLGRFEPEELLKRDVILYVHGFRTDPVLLIERSREIYAAIAALDRYASGPPPLFIHFAWPGSVPPTQFDKAQAAAEGSAVLLKEILSQLKSLNRTARTVVVAHSLGANVAMESLLIAEGAGADAPLVDAMVLVQGAIRAVSVRSWTSTSEMRFPGLEVYSLIDKTIDPTPIVANYQSGIGRFHGASRLARRLIVTTSPWDNVLGLAFSTKELHFPRTPLGPQLMPVPGGTVLGKGEVNVLAIGTPFPGNPVLEVWPPVENPMADIAGSERDPASLRLQPLNPRDILSQTTIRYTFAIGHPDYREIPLSPLIESTEWHSPLQDVRSRDVLLKAIWNFVDH